MEDLVALLFLLPSAEKVLLDDICNLKKMLYSMPGIFSQRHLHALPVKQLFSYVLMRSTKILGSVFGKSSVWSSL